MNVNIREVGASQGYALVPVCALPKGLLSEARSYELRVEMDGASIPDDLDLTINDIPLDRITRARNPIFRFDLGFYAGDLRIAITRGARVIWTTSLEVDPDISKVTRDEYATMISEIAKATLALYRLSAVTVPAEVKVGGFASDLVTLELVRTNFDVFDHAVSKISSQPLRVLQSVSIMSDVMRARRVTDRAISGALRSGRSRAATVAEAQVAPALVGALGGRWVPRVLENRRQETLDLYEHRALLGFLRWLDSELADVVLRLSVAREQILPIVRSIYVDRVLRWRARIANLRRRDLFSKLLPESALYATSAFRMRPDYATAFSAMLRMKLGLGLSSAATPAMPVDRTFQLYELWCYVGVLAAVAERFPHSRTEIARLLHGCRSANELGIILSKGEANSIPLTPNLSLTYQRRIGPEPSYDGARTRLVEVVPDISISRRSKEGVCDGLVIMDPKYRVGSSLLDGVRDMHVYRDAILDASGAELVKAAVALSPRPKDLPETISTMPTDRPAVMTARPTHDPFTFTRLLDAALALLGSSHDSLHS